MFTKRIILLFYILCLFIIIIFNLCKKEYSVKYLNRIFKGYTMGTSYSIHFSCIELEKVISLISLKRKIFDKLKNINKIMSTYINSSSISNFNSFFSTNLFFIGKDFSFILNKSICISIFTNKAFNITLDSLINLWGFDKSKNHKVIPVIEKVSKIINHMGLYKIKVIGKIVKKLDPKLTVNFSSIAKGYAVDILYNIIRKEGFQNFLVEIGGEIRTKGMNRYGNKWKIGIYTPILLNRDKGIIRIIKLENKSLATSGVYLNFFKNNNIYFSHIINSRTGNPIKNNLLSVTVISNTCVIADALATSFLVLGEKNTLSIVSKIKRISVFFVYRKRNVYY